MHEAFKRYLDMSNQAPVYHRGLIERNIETVRRRLAAEFGCDPEEIAITRNASESLQIAQIGLDLKPGDEVLTTEQDYRADADHLGSAARRDKIKVTRLHFPVPDRAGRSLSAARERDHAADQGAALLPHHQPSPGSCSRCSASGRMARQRGITTIVDGAHALAHFPFKLRDLEMRFLRHEPAQMAARAASARACSTCGRSASPSTWPLQAAPDAQTTTSASSSRSARSRRHRRRRIDEAIAFHQAIGIERKAARLRYLTLRWAIS